VDKLAAMATAKQGYSIAGRDGGAGATEATDEVVLSS
jgi:hypothetical protein